MFVSSFAISVKWKGRSFHRRRGFRNIVAVFGQVCPNTRQPSLLIFLVKGFDKEKSNTYIYILLHNFFFFSIF